MSIREKSITFINKSSFREKEDIEEYIRVLSFFRKKVGEKQV